ncbi:MAG TPA: glycoside hydrolase family 5 protein [Candidatus Marinimicrobia bacterium]|nr:glycoside hydrolase family 5 protein [Candidatus Neomarinimicrobiota bacterium]
MTLFWAAACPDEKKPAENKQFLEADPFARNELLGRTMNLGNALEAPAEGEWGVTLHSHYFDSIAAAGFTAVRVPIRWSAHALPVAPHTIEPSFLTRVQWVVAQSERVGLAPIIDFHHYVEIFSEPEAHRKRFLEIWKQIATVFQYGDTALFYEVLNEPHDNLTAELWNELLAEAIDTIRAIDSVHTLIIGTAEWGGIAAMNKLKIPDDEDNIIFTFHYYEPFQFTHQGAGWNEGSEAWLGTTWSGTPQQQQNIIADLSQVKNWAAQQNLPVFLGEFGAYHRAPMESRALWTQYVRHTAESMNMSWAYWEFCSGFGAYNANTESWRPQLLQALIP